MKTSVELQAELDELRQIHNQMLEMYTPMAVALLRAEQKRERERGDELERRMIQLEQKTRAAITTLNERNASQKQDIGYLRKMIEEQDRVIARLRSELMEKVNGLAREDVQRGGVGESEAKDGRVEMPSAGDRRPEGAGPSSNGSESHSS